MKLSSEGSKVQKIKMEKENMKESLDEERDRSNRYRKQKNQAEDKIENREGQTIRIWSQLESDHWSQGSSARL